MTVPRYAATAPAATAAAAAAVFLLHDNENPSRLKG